jgi:hypothetical protein
MRVAVRRALAGYIARIFDDDYRRWGIAPRPENMSFEDSKDGLNSITKWRNANIPPRLAGFYCADMKNDTSRCGVTPTIVNWPEITVASTDIDRPA